MPPASVFLEIETMRLRGNAKLWQTSKKVTGFLWIRFIILSDD
jgi:hypothetical protein